MGTDSSRRYLCLHSQCTQVHTYSPALPHPLPPNPFRRVACLHDPATGPVHHLITQLLAAGRRSCRMASLTALQLAGCWALHPASAAHYTDTLRELCLYGFADDATALNGADDAVVDPETLLDLAAVRAPPDGTLAEAHAATELAPRVATLCLLHAWVQQAQQLGEDKLAADSRRTGHTAWAQLLHLALHDPELSSPKYQFKGTTHRRKASAGGGMEFGVMLRAHWHEDREGALPG